MSELNFLKVAIVGGTWDENGGRSSGYVTKLGQASGDEGMEISLFNGGNFSSLEKVLNGKTLLAQDVIFWLANIPNDLPKIVGVKKVYPHKLLVSSKRNNNEYIFAELINRALLQKANLCSDFCKNDGKIHARLFDPLGVVWQPYTDDIAILAKSLKKRLAQIKQFTRQGTIQIDAVPLEIPDQPSFFSLIKQYAKVFHSLIQPVEGVTRFLGNTSFRCERGFPSMRDPKSGLIFMSRRDVDKSFIDKDSFVAVKYDRDILYWGPYKPSVDTPIQVRLYEALPQINYMLHAHVYVEDAPMTTLQIPCGAIEEVNEVLSLVKNQEDDFIVINLLGHGCLIMASDHRKMDNLPFIKRPSPEYLAL